MLNPDGNGGTLAPNATSYAAQGAGPVLDGAVAGVNIKPVNASTTVCQADFWKGFVSGDVTITGINNGEGNFAEGHIDLLLLDGVSTLKGDFKTGTCLGTPSNNPGSVSDLQVCFTGT